MNENVRKQVFEIFNLFNIAINMRLNGEIVPEELENYLDSITFGEF